MVRQRQPTYTVNEKKPEAPSQSRTAGMEEAYNELFQQFMKLRSLCLKQAALLQQLTSTMRQQGGIPPVAAILSGDDNVKVSGAAHNHAGHPGVQQTSRHMGKEPDVSADDMSQLNMNVPQHCQETATSTLRPTEDLSRTTRTLGAARGDNQSGMFLTSDLAFQSHVCNFCQAVFPENSTTQGEFLRHLCTHVN